MMYFIKVNILFLLVLFILMGHRFLSTLINYIYTKIIIIWMKRKEQIIKNATKMTDIKNIVLDGLVIYYYGKNNILHYNILCLL
ncbi:MAG: hypothetical protein EBR82_24055 [Caulobacteraceae bacterium]|nr:hypothetical protein [Caulobacteraceae bacterium]